MKLPDVSSTPALSAVQTRYHNSEHRLPLACSAFERRRIVTLINCKFREHDLLPSLLANVL